MQVLSIDLGTSNTVAVLSAHGRQRVVEVDGSAMMPSAVFAADDGSLVVGRDAERRARLEPARFEPNPKRRIDEGTLLLGDTVVSVTDALAAVLRRVGEETVRQLGGGRPDEVRLTHPAQWGPVRRNTLLSAARQAGLGANLVLVPEPVAAAAHFASFPGQSLAPGQALAVYDLGAGTFDVAVVGATQQGFVVLAEAGLADLGGLDVDQAVLEHVGRQISQRDPASWQRLLRPESTGDRRTQRALYEDMKVAKETLSRHPQTEVPLPSPFEDVLVTRTELEALIRPSLLRSVELLASTIRTAGGAPEQLAGIYLVGGSSRIPLVATLIAEGLRVVPTSLDQPETAVALGAHHVPQEGISMRTQDLGGMPGLTEQTVQVRQTPYPSSGPQPTYPTGGYPVQTGYPQTGGYPAQQQFPQQKQAGGKKPLLIGAAVLVVLALAAVAAIVYWPRTDDLPTAQDCQQAGSVDAKGLTPCLRQLAGTVADKDCHSASGSGAVVAECALDDGFTVTYSQGAGSVQDDVDDQLAGTQGRPRVEADWKGNGLDGRYQAATTADAGVLVFTVKDRPIYGVLKKDGVEAPELADYFESKVQPGT